MPSVAVAAAVADGMPVGALARRLSESGITVSVVTGRVRLARIGGPGRIRLYAAGVLMALFTVPLSRLARVGRALWAR